jgi:hypothetical protein
MLTPSALGLASNTPPPPATRPQHYLTMLGATVLIPFLLVPAMGGNGQGEGLQQARCCLGRVGSTLSASGAAS